MDTPFTKKLQSDGDSTSCCLEAGVKASHGNLPNDPTANPSGVPSLLGDVSYHNLC